MTHLMQVRALAASLEAADAHGLLHALADAPATPAALAARCRVDATACARVLAVLHAHGILGCDAGEYVVPEMVRHELRGPDAHDNGGGDGVWKHAVRFAGSGEPVRPMRDPTDRGTVYAGTTPLLARMFEPLAERLADALAGRCTHTAAPAILDVGAGSGVWSLALARRLPGATVSALDLPDVLPRFLERAARLEMAHRAVAMPGDFHDGPAAGARYDVVLLANVLHLEPAAAAGRLIARWREAVADGGLLVIVDMLADETTNRAHAAYALHLALRMPGAYPHLESELRAWLGAAGLVPVERLTLVDGAPEIGALVGWGRASTNSSP
jgi:SAM-dependent methyltransferase